MKELVKSKVMVGFLVFVLGVTYISSMQTQKLEEDNQLMRETTIAMQLK